MTVQGFEIGNEFYQQFNENNLEAVDDFAELQAQMASWVRDEVGTDQNVYIQAARTQAANEILRDVFFRSSTDDLDINDINGIITHLYYSPSGQDLTRINAVKNRLEMLDGVWGAYDFDTIVTEWNAGENPGYDGVSAVYGFARITVLTRGFADFIGFGADELMFWSTIAGGSGGRSTLARQEEFGETYLTPTGYWFRLMASELIDTELVSSYSGSASLQDDTGTFVGYSYVFRGTGTERDDYHVLYTNGLNDELSLNVDLANLISIDSFAYAAIIRKVGDGPADDPHVNAQLEFISIADGTLNIVLQAYEFLQVNIVTGHGIDLETDPFNAVDDTMKLSAFDDSLKTFAGNDNITAGQGNDTVWGGLGNDTLRGENDVDVLYGDAGADVLKGGWGNDTLYGGSEGDKLYGGRNEDILLGESGWDTLYGEDGNDTLNGGGGNDRLYGGAGVDVFVFEGNFGKDRIYDFDANDVVDITALTDINGFDDLNITQVGGAAQITVGNNFFKIIGYNVQELTADDFLFS